MTVEPIQNPTFWGSQSVVATDSILDAVSTLPNGGYVVAWRGGNDQISFQIYNGNREKVGGIQSVDAPADGLSQWQPDIFTKPDGSFVITWTEATGATSGGRILKSQTFNIDGGATDDAITLPTTVRADGAHVTGNGSGSLVTAYVKEGGKLALTETSSQGASLETVFDIDAANSEVNIDWTGNGYAVSYLTNNGLSIGVVLTNGTSVLYPTIQGIGESDLVALKAANGGPNGTFVATYVANDYTIKVDTFYMNGNAIIRDKSVTIASPPTDSNGLKTSITALHDGGYAVAYKNGNPSDMFVKVFNRDGQEGPAIRIPVNGQQDSPAISEMADGRLAVSWHDPSLNDGAIETVIVDARAEAVKAVGTAQNDIYAPSKHAGDDFDGGAGIDTLTFKESTAGVAVNLAAGSGSAGDAAGDIYKNFENIVGTSYGDSLAGGAGANRLDGGAGSDYLDGGADADVLIGGAGNDTYILDHTGDVVQESAAGDGGVDTVYTSASHTLEAFVENMIATGSGAISLTGNDWSNGLNGNEAANWIAGLGGNDVLNGAGGNDALDGGAGNDALDGGVGNDVLAGGIGDDNLQGGSGDDNLQGGDGNDALNGADGNDVLDGGSGNDVLHGGAGADNLKGGLGDDVIDGQGGADTMDGGAGNDTYYIDDSNDLVQDSGAGDVDTVVVSVNYNLSQLVGVENITGVGSAAITLTGNGLNNTFAGNDGTNILYGGAGKDRLNGLGGNDRIHGGLGADVLTGGKGRDNFVFDTNPKAKGNRDKIMDFNVKDDTIYLENRYFKALGKKGTLKKPAKMASKMFYSGTKAHDKDDHVIYDKKKGVLYYDDDGIGSHKAIVIATLKKGLKMTYHDFLVI